MKERPILMSGPLVIATMKGQKTQTRRVMNPQPEPEAIAVALGTDGIFRPNWWANERQHLEDFRIGEPLICPYGAPGDRLWVREAWRSWKEAECQHEDDEACSAHCQQLYVAYRATPRDGYRPRPDKARITYLDDSTPIEHDPRLLGPWRPSIHMPRAASRLTLEITDVRAQRLQAISEENARAEGVDWAAPQFDEAEEARDEDPREVGYPREGGSFARDNFRRLWDAINGKRLVGGKPITWAADPWVWVISYRVVK